MLIIITKVTALGEDWREVIWSEDSAGMNGTHNFIKDAADSLHALDPFCHVRIQEDAILGAENSSSQTPNLPVPISWTSWLPEQGDTHLCCLQITQSWIFSYSNSNWDIHFSSVGCHQLMKSVVWTSEWHTFFSEQWQKVPTSACLAIRLSDIIVVLSPWPILYNLGVAFCSTHPTWLLGPCSSLWLRIASHLWTLTSELSPLNSLQWKSLVPRDARLHVHS